MLVFTMLSRGVWFEPAVLQINWVAWHQYCLLQVRCVGPKARACYCFAFGLCYVGALQHAAKTILAISYKFVHGTVGSSVLCRIFTPSKHSLPIDFDACQFLLGRKQEAMAFQVDVHSNVSFLMVVADLASSVFGLICVCIRLSVLQLRNCICNR